MERNHQEIGFGERRSGPNAEFRILQHVRPPHPVPDLEIAPKFLSDVVESLFCLLPGARVLVHDDDIESGGWTPFARQHLSGCQKRLHILNVEKFVKHLLVFSLLERADLLPNLSKMGPRPDIRGFPILS